ncbi:MAG: hypothetical protein MJ209_07895 [archaeon]|nr:hypothetical protein [archaeon]
MLKNVFGEDKIIICDLEDVYITSFKLYLPNDTFQRISCDGTYDSIYPLDEILKDSNTINQINHNKTVYLAIQEINETVTLDHSSYYLEEVCTIKSDMNIKIYLIHEK